MRLLSLPPLIAAILAAVCVGNARAVGFRQYVPPGNYDGGSREYLKNALLNWMRDVITERNLEAEWGEAEAEDEYPSAAASTSIGHSLEDDDGGVRGGGHAIPQIGEMGRADLSANLWDRNVRVPFYR